MQSYAPTIPFYNGYTVNYERLLAPTAKSVIG